MANAIHRTESGDTLAGVSQQYYAVRRPDGAIRRIELGRVTRAIREATGESLSGYDDSASLPAGFALAIPTIRELNRAVFADDPVLDTALAAHGFDHARKLLRYSPVEVAKSLKPLPKGTTEAQVRRAWMLTALLNLDGMDRYTARYLHDEVGIGSLKELASQSRATIDSILEKLTGQDHGRPPELATQDHARRWIVSAKILVRKRISELTKIRDRFFQVPFEAGTAKRQAEFYDNATADGALTSEEAGVAARLSRLYRFQAALIRGNVGVRSGNWADAIAGYQDARRHWHRLAEETGALAAVDDRFGLNFNSCVETSRRLLAQLPADEDSPLGAPAVPLRRGGTRKGYRLRGFRYDELNPASKQELQAALADLPVHKLPRRSREAVSQAALGKTRADLRRADATLVQGLIAGSDASLTRDLEEQDRHVLQRNLGALRTGRLYAGDTGLGIFEAIGDSLSISDVAQYLPDPWTSGNTGTTGRSAVSFLSDTAQSQFPAAFLQRSDLTAATRFLVMPGEGAGSTDRFVPLGASFHADYEEQLMKPRLISTAAEDLLFDDEVWSSAAAFAAAAPYLYATQIPMGLRRAYSEVNQPHLVRQFGGLRINTYNTDGSLAYSTADVSPADWLAFDPDLLACSTDYTGTASVQFPWALLSYAEGLVTTADYAYRHDDREKARASYADVRCAIEKFFPTFAGEAGAAMTGVLLAIQSINSKTFQGPPVDRNLRNLSTLDVVIVQDDVPHRVMEDTFLQVRRPTTGSALSAAARGETISSYFDFHVLVEKDPVTGTVSQADDDVPDVDVDTESSGDGTVENGGFQIYTNHDATAGQVSTYFSGAALLYQVYLYCVAKIQAIDAGLNWYGYPDEFVPAWSFEHLYNLGRDLSNRALEAEQRVFALLQMYATALETEFLAAQSEELSGVQLAIADARVEQQVASNVLATAQALASQQQAEAQSKKSGVAASVTMAVTAVGAAAGAAVGIVVSGGTAAPAIIAGTAAAAGPTAGFVGTITGHTQDVKVLEKAKGVTAATLLANSAALNVAIAERDVAALQTEQAAEYVDFLMSQTLNSDAYLFLLGMARSILETYIYHANRMAWLAERALEHETRQAYDLIALDYTTEDELADLTRAQQITAGLETLRSEYTAGQTARLQEVEWTISLSELDPIAWRDLRDTGTCTFVLRQRGIDMFFPGLYQHRLKDVRVEISGLVPPEGARGILTNPGVSSVRVPNEQAFLTGTVEDDWTTTSLAGSATFDPYDQYVMKQVLTNPVALTLSQFDIRSDRAVLAAPQGMLTPVQHLGLDSGWTLKLHRQSNNFDFRHIVDASFTFWFLCAYDSELEQAQVNALVEEGNRGLLTGVARTAFAVHQPDEWIAFAGTQANGEELDLRYLVVDVANLPLWEQQRKLKNVLLGCARLAAESEITLRLCCDLDPAGALVTTSGGAAYTLIGADASNEDPPPVPNTDLEAWIRHTFYFRVPDIDLPVGNPGPPRKPDLWVPFRGPEHRWVVKASPTQAGEVWQKRDEDGALVTTSCGPLHGFAGGSALYDGGSDWTDISATAKVAHGGGTVRLTVRDDGSSYYALEIGPATVKLLKVVAGAERQLGESLALAWPEDEFLLLELRVVGSRVSASIDRMTLFDDIDGETSAGSLQSGSVAFRVVSTSGRPAGFDDLKVVRLTGRGVEAEALLNEPFTSQLPAEWTFTDGTSGWNIAAQGMPVFDLSQLLNVVLSLDYRHEMAADQ